VNRYSHCVSGRGRYEVFVAFIAGLAVFTHHGGVAQCLERQSLTGELSLIYA